MSGPCPSPRHRAGRVGRAGCPSDRGHRGRRARRGRRSGPSAPHGHVEGGRPSATPVRAVALLFRTPYGSGRGQAEARAGPPRGPWSLKRTARASAALQLRRRSGAHYGYGWAGIPRHTPHHAQRPARRALCDSLLFQPPLPSSASLPFPLFGRLRACAPPAPAPLVPSRRGLPPQPLTHASPPHHPHPHLGPSRCKAKTTPTPNPLLFPPFHAQLRRTSPPPLARLCCYLFGPE